jgi:MoxR-like ATPase
MSAMDQRTRGEIDAVIAGLAASRYICSHHVSGAALAKPILVEGPAGVGKTELAKATATFLELPLVWRLRNLRLERQTRRSQSNKNRPAPFFVLDGHMFCLAFRSCIF